MHTTDDIDRRSFQLGETTVQNKASVHTTKVTIGQTGNNKCLVQAFAMFVNIDNFQRFIIQQRY